MKYLTIATITMISILFGCEAFTPSQVEYSCSGFEQSFGQYDNLNPSESFIKRYPIEIDFHVRKSNVLVKSHVAEIVSDDKGQINFSTESAQNWLSGRFNRSDKLLSIVSRQNLKIDNVNSTTQLSGQYVCKEI